MALVSCKECGNGVSPAAAACPKCGHPVTWKPAAQPEKEKMGTGKKVFLVFFTLIVAFISFAVIMSGSPEANERYRAKSAIALCWSDHEKKSLGQDEKRFIASTCEMMERKFTQEHGYSP